MNSTALSTILLTAALAAADPLILSALIHNKMENKATVTVSMMFFVILILAT
jgi:hypothetical protein